MSTIRFQKIKIYLVLIFFSLVLLIVAISYLGIKVYVVKTDSMAPIINKEELVITIKTGLISSQKKRNDVYSFLFKESRNDPGTIFIKRLVGNPGDLVYITNDSLYIDQSVFIHDPVYFLMRSDDLENSYLSSLGLIQSEECIKLGISNCAKIPSNKYFFIGDNYSNSMDSRVWGLISGEFIIGKVIVVI